MHFWIDKRSHTCGLHGRHGIPVSLASGRRRGRNKSMVAPVHRIQSVESSTLSEPLRRPYQQPEPQPGLESISSRLSQAPGPSVENESCVSTASPTIETDAPIYINPHYEAMQVMSPQFMRIGGLTKYGMWASFGLTTVSMAATKFYIDHQGTLEIILLCTLGALSVGILITCVMTVCKKKEPIVIAQAQVCQHSAMDIEIPEITSQRETTASPIANTSQTITAEEDPTPNSEQPPPPYHIAILLPLKENSSDLPPPTYESAIR